MKPDKSKPMNGYRRPAPEHRAPQQFPHRFCPSDPDPNLNPNPNPHPHEVVCYGENFPW